MATLDKYLKLKGKNKDLYFIQKRIPKKLQFIFSYDVMNRSLETSDIRVARQRRDEILLGLEQLEDRLIQGEFDIMLNKFEQLDEGIIAKASSGGLEYTDIVTSNNLSNCLSELKKNKYWVIGFDSEANSNIEDSVFNLQDRIVLIFGEEGKGMRNLTKKLCDVTYRINTIGEIKSLNVSVAIGIILDKITTKLG